MSIRVYQPHNMQTRIPLVTGTASSAKLQNNECKLLVYPGLKADLVQIFKRQ